MGQAPSAGQVILTWKNLYSESELYKAAVRLYTKPIFAWRKALAASSDQKTFYDFARHGLRNLNQLHHQLRNGTFRFRPGIVLRHNFNGKHRTIYVYPWEERVVDLVLYRTITRRLDAWFSPHSYAYRHSALDLRRCQHRVAQTLRNAQGPFFVLKRDIVDYFASIAHEPLLRQMAALVPAEDYLFRLLLERIRFTYLEGGQLQTAPKGVPFGTAVACVLANIYLTDLDKALSFIPDLTHFRYSDDLLAIAARPEPIRAAEEIFNASLVGLQLRSKPSQQRNWVLSRAPVQEAGFESVDRFRHLGLEFRADRSVGLSRDKSRKLCNLFRYAFGRRRRMFSRLPAIDQRLALAIRLARETLENGLRHVALIDYYLRHTTDVAQWQGIDRWLAEEVLSVVLRTGHRKSHFRRISFQELRRRGLPSLAHRRQLILHGHIETPFFMWKNRQVERGVRGAAARGGTVGEGPRLFSPIPKAAAGIPS